MADQQAAGATIAIVGGNAVVGQALELLIEGLGYRARFEPGPTANGSARPLAGAHLVVLAPGLSAARRDAVLAQAPDADRPGGIPVLELTAGGRPAAPGPHVRWPCRADDLGRAIEAALRARLCSGRA